MQKQTWKKAITWNNYSGVILKTFSHLSSMDFRNEYPKCARKNLFHFKVCIKPVSSD